MYSYINFWQVEKSAQRVSVHEPLMSIFSELPKCDLGTLSSRVA